MTAIVKNREVQAPQVTRVGLVVPGLGHLLAGLADRAGGAIITGVGLLSLDAALLWAAVSGFPRLHDVLFSASGGRLAIHPIIALIAWLVTLIAVWWASYRRAFPRQLTDAEFNSNTQVSLRQFYRSQTGMLGLYGALFLVVMALLAPLIAPFEPNMVSLTPKETPPSWLYLMGTDHFGRDLFSRVLYGGRISLSIGFVAVGIAATIGTSVGALAAFGGGWVDRGLMWFVDLLLSLPRLVLLLAITGLFRLKGAESLFLLIAILGLTGWMGVARIVRSQMLSFKEQDFVQAARALGFSDVRILFRHLIPNALSPVIVYCSLAIGSTMLTEAGLSFLGLGVSPPTSTWGSIINDGRDLLINAPWIATFPGLCIVAAVMSFNLLGDGLRDALDPKLRGS